jgi:UDP-galactopyranose mutase
MQGIIEQKQMKDFMRLYTGLVEKCFDSCCNDFTSKALSTKEVSVESRNIQSIAVLNVTRMLFEGNLRRELHAKVA